MHAEIEWKKTSQIVHKQEKHIVFLKTLSRSSLSYFGHGQNYF